MSDTIDMKSAEGMEPRWQDIKEASGVVGADHGMYYPDEFEPGHEAMTAIRKDYRWTPACQRAFLEELACYGSVTRATQYVEKSARAAYALRFRAEGAAFRLGWDAAILVARDRLADMLMDRSINGYEQFTQKEEDGTRRHGKFDNRVSMHMLSRLDRIAEREALTGSRDAQVQLVVQDFEAFLDLIANGGKGAEASLFFEAREPDDGDGDYLRYEIEHELAQISADEEEAEAERAPEHLTDEQPEAAAARMGVWWDAKWEKWFTNFPIAPEDRSEEDFTCADDGVSRFMCEQTAPVGIVQIGAFGHHGYRRTLTAAEEKAHYAKIEANLAPWTEAAQAAREMWFGEKLAA